MSALTDFNLNFKFQLKARQPQKYVIAKSIKQNVKNTHPIQPSRLFFCGTTAPRPLPTIDTRKQLHASIHARVRRRENGHIQKMIALAKVQVQTEAEMWSSWRLLNLHFISLFLPQKSKAGGQKKIPKGKADKQNLLFINKRKHLTN